MMSRRSFLSMSPVALMQGMFRGDQPEPEADTNLNLTIRTTKLEFMDSIILTMFLEQHKFNKWVTDHLFNTGSRFYEPPRPT